ncbi:hypothetical protein SOVF_089270 [Spinacia oleracea]|nr:hypothetical protein SOVF_089270 [Spinacia oleracea]
MPHHLRLLLTAALLISAVISTTSTRECPPCGTTRVPYPLSTAPTCGDQEYIIQCNNNSTLLFPTSNNTYPITSINANNQRLVIEPSPFLPNTCITSDISTQGVQLNQTAPFNVTGDNTVMFLNCSQSLLGSPLNCSSNSLCHVYVNSTREASACQSSPICCTFRAGGGTTSYSIRVREGGCRAYRSFVDLNPSLPVGQWGQPGLMIQWLLPQEPVCRTQADCAVDDGNSTCRADPSSVGTSRCFCNSGLHWDGVNGICAENDVCGNQGGCNNSNKAALIAGLVSGIGGALILATIVAMYYKRQRRIKEAQERLKKEREEVLNSGGGRTAKIFSGREIKKATNHFSRDRLLGSGGYGDVYKGVLYDGTLTAVKCAKGTLGYLDPEYYRNYQLTDKSDVYSFGVVLLELLTSQKAIDFHREADDVNLAMYVKRLVDEERMLDAVDPLLKEGASTLEIDTIKALGFLAIGCLEERRQNRPSMKEVAEEIEYIISIATAEKAEH